MIRNKFKCPICGAISTPIMWMEETASSSGVQYREVRDIKNVSSSPYMCPECKKTVKRNKIEVVVTPYFVKKKVIKQIVSDVRAGIESIRVALSENGTGYLFTFDKSGTEPTVVCDDAGQPKTLTFNVGDITLPTVVLKDGSKNIDHQHPDLVGGAHVIANYNVATDKATYTLAYKNGSPMHNIGEILQQYELKIAAIQGIEPNTSPMVGIFTRDDRYVSHCADCPERYTCASAELRPEYGR